MKLLRRIYCKHNWESKGVESGYVEGSSHLIKKVCKKCGKITYVACEYEYRDAE